MHTACPDTTPGHLLCVCVTQSQYGGGGGPVRGPTSRGRSHMRVHALPTFCTNAQGASNSIGRTRRKDLYIGRSPVAKRDVDKRADTVGWDQRPYPPTALGKYLRVQERIAACRGTTPASIRVLGPLPHVVSLRLPALAQRPLSKRFCSKICSFWHDTPKAGHTAQSF